MTRACNGRTAQNRPSVRQSVSHSVGRSSLYDQSTDRPRCAATPCRDVMTPHCACASQYGRTSGLPTTLRRRKQTTSRHAILSRWTCMIRPFQTRFSSRIYNACSRHISLYRLALSSSQQIGCEQRLRNDLSVPTGTPNYNRINLHLKSV